MEVHQKCCTSVKMSMTCSFKLMWCVWIPWMSSRGAGWCSVWTRCSSWGRWPAWCWRGLPCPAPGWTCRTAPALPPPSPRTRAAGPWCSALCPNTAGDRVNSADRSWNVTYFYFLQIDHGPVCLYYLMEERIIG